MSTDTLDIKVKRIHRLHNSQNLKAFVDIVVNEAIVIKSVKVVEGSKGLFVSMPQEQAKDKKWYESVQCIKPEVRQLITDQVLAAFQAEN
jgi:stage V sporulation protein G